jgi:hypothetical protein
MAFCMPCRSWNHCDRLANSPPRISSQFGPHSIFSIRSPVSSERGRAVGWNAVSSGASLQVLVVEVERLVEVVDLRQVGVGERSSPASATCRHRLRAAGQPAAAIAHPAAVPAFSWFSQSFGITDPRLGLDVVEPGVLHAFARGPHVLAGDRAGVAADALVQVQHHRRSGRGLSSHHLPRGAPRHSSLVAGVIQPVDLGPSCARSRTRRGSYPTVP